MTSNHMSLHVSESPDRMICPLPLPAFILGILVVDGRPLQEEEEAYVGSRVARSTH
jgi:hypothetical protein